MKDITLEYHKIAVSGQVVSTSGTSFFLDDGTGQLLVRTEKLPMTDFVKVYGRLLAYEDSYELVADIVQDYSSADKELLRKVKELLRKENQKLK